MNFNIIPQYLGGFISLYLLSTLLLWGQGQSLSPTSDYVIIKDIQIDGNKRTLDRIILREMDIIPGDTIRRNELETRLIDNRNRIYNTNLFEKTELTLIEGDAVPLADLQIDIVERWYLFPVPIFELSDRNFNEWWVTYEHDLRRTEFGFSLNDYNSRGRNEVLSLLFQFGFTKKFGISYKIPNLGKDQSWGLHPKFDYNANPSIAYRSNDNQLNFYQHNKYVLRRWGTGININKRLDFYQTASLELSYFNNQVEDTIALMNKDYFLDGRTKQRYFFTKLSYRIDHRDIRNYPLTGFYFRTSVAKYGWGIFKDINMIALNLTYSHYFQLAKNTYAIANIKGKISLPDQQPWYNQKGLGYSGNLLRGYEYYVIDGQKWGLLRTAIKQTLFQREIKSPISIGGRLASIPVAIYLRLYGETGYVDDQYYYENNPLANSLLYSTGLGLDIVTFYDSVLVMEYSINRRKEHGFFLHFKMNYDARD